MLIFSVTVFWDAYSTLLCVALRTLPVKSDCARNSNIIGEYTANPLVTILRHRCVWVSWYTQRPCIKVLYKHEWIRIRKSLKINNFGTLLLFPRSVETDSFDLFWQKTQSTFTSASVQGSPVEIQQYATMVWGCSCPDQWRNRRGCHSDYVAPDDWILA